MKNIDEKIRRAIANKDLEKLLTGEKPYTCEISEFIPVSVPTDWPNIIRTMYLVFENDKSIEIDLQLENTLIMMCNKNYFTIYCAIMVCFVQIMNQRDNSASFYINIDRIITVIKKNIYIYKDELMICKNWSGYRFKDGLWGDISRVDNILYEDYGMRIL